MSRSPADETKKQRGVASCHEGLWPRVRIATALVILSLATALPVEISHAGKEANRIGRGIEVRTASLDHGQSEPFIAVAPRDSRRIVAVAMDRAFETPPATGNRNVYISSDRGRSWTVLESNSEGDLTSVADTAGTFWVAGLDHESEATFGADVSIARIAPGTNAIAAETKLPRHPAMVAVDKPSISVDNSVSSPTYGRLYATHLSLGSEGYLGVLLTYCDTRVEQSYVPERCDERGNWSTPFPVPGGHGLNWSPEVATGPEGETYVVWYSHNASAILGAACSSDCTTPGSFVPSVIAEKVIPSMTVNVNLSSCQPGVAGATPSVDVDISQGPQRGRVYVTWMDIRMEDASAPCPNDPSNRPHRSLDAYIASEVGRLPGGPFPSHVAGTLLYQEGERDWENVTGAAVSDEFYPNVAVDDVNGKAWVSFYSTRLDPSRGATNVYVRAIKVIANSARPLTLRRVSSTVDLSDEGELCFCYGHYAGLDVADGWPYPVWVGGTSSDKDVYTWIPR